MAKFLHEFTQMPNGTTCDNGWWEIRGNKLVNSKGGWHDYYPNSEDKIIESNWDYIEHLNAKNKINDKFITGWIAPEGTFYGCDYQDHHYVAEYLDLSEFQMENQGYVKIYYNPLFLEGHGNEYEYFCDKHLTNAQREVLITKGIEL